MVETFRRREFAGWVAVPYHCGTTRVTLHVNDVEVAATWAGAATSRRAEGNVGRFRFSIYDLWKYTKRTDKVSIRANGVPLAIPAKGLYYHPRSDGEFAIDELQTLLQAGYVFGQSGRLQMSKTRDFDWQSNVVGLYERVNQVLAKQGYQSFFIYGTLLGAVREKGFICHYLDFDAAYISRHTTGPEAAAELVDLAFLLIDNGFKVVGKRTCLAIYDEKSEGLKIDLFHLYFDEGNEICFPFGVAGESALTRDQVGELIQISIGDHVGLAPADPEPLVAHIYGPNWRTPDPGFRWQNDRAQSDRGGILTEAQVEEVYWADFYSRTTYSSGSSFADYILGLNDLPTAGVEFGCGDGRDVFAFGAAGRHVVGLDRSHVGTRHASNHSKKLGLEDRVRFLECDVNDYDQVCSIIDDVRAQHSDAPLLFYNRFFLHSVPEQTQETLLAAISERSQPGDYFASEFRTDRDEANQKVHGKHYRRFQDPQDLIEQLEKRHGFRVVVQQQGNGFSPYKGEDPDLARIVAVKNNTEHA